MNDNCMICGSSLPPLNGSEENDFKYLCEDCVEEQKSLRVSF